MLLRNIRFHVLPALVTLILLAPSCRTKSGCPANADMAPKTNKRGQIVARKSKASEGLFPKKMKKKVGVKG